MPVPHRLPSPSSLRRLGAAATAGACLLAVTPAARAEPVDLITDGATLVNRADWDFFQYPNATLGGSGPFALVNEGGLVGGQTDAFDGAFGISVDGTAVGARNGVADVEGRTLTFRPVTVAGLKVSITWFAVRSSSTLRVLVKLKNPGRQDVRRTVRVGSNLGSDAGTTIGATSSGDLVWGTDDRWVVTDDGGAPGDPAVLQVWGGKGETAPRTGLTRPTADTFVVDTSVRVPAGKSRYVLAFADLATDGSASRVAADRFETRVPTGGVLEGLSAAVRRAIVNWDL